MPKIKKTKTKRLVVKKLPYDKKELDNWKGDFTPTMKSGLAKYGFMSVKRMQEVSKIYRKASGRSASHILNKTDFYTFVDDNFTKKGERKKVKK